MHRFAFPLDGGLLFGLAGSMAHASEWDAPLEPNAFHVWESYSSGLQSSEG